MSDIQGLFSIKKKRILLKAGNFKVPYQNPEQAYNHLKHLIQKRKGEKP